MSFAIPVTTGITAIEIHDPGAPPTVNCPGTSGNPDAAAGAFCVYAVQKINVRDSGSCVAAVGAAYVCSFVEPFGTTIFSSANGAGQVSWAGTWAVRAQ